MVGQNTNINDRDNNKYISPRFAQFYQLCNQLFQFIFRIRSSILEISYYIYNRQHAWNENNEQHRNKKLITGKKNLLADEEQLRAVGCLVSQLEKKQFILS